ncbi:cytochrome b-type NAD(P)H oxidoreductase [Cryptosporidium ryanae]|uniref:cytochrome b-type NAD(P)H oxidoreductase n=1 Tax=Cryptosporidium ryanae TaxID=515981 RepID=UPI00351A8A2A|nr:cytochrome b-type NAD(P)H oxidoreductase [Cryptosporidium ryanae]
MYRSGLLVCKFVEGSDANITWPSGKSKEWLVNYIENSIKQLGGFDNDDILEVEVCYVEDEDKVLWKGISIPELVDAQHINIIRVVKIGDERKKNIQETAAKIRGLINTKRNSMNQARYIQIMGGGPKEYNLNRRVSVEELKSHASESDCWIAYKGKVYDITKYLEFHPGGKEILLQFAGKDISTACSYFHHWVNCERILQFDFVGILDN